MRWLDWAVVAAYLIWVVTSGIRASRRTDELDGYFRANRSLPWWAVGLSVMATQLSAITLVGTTGKAYADGMRFVQIYFGLPIAMVILSVTVVPFFYKANVFTAYEYLERRFDVNVRTLAAFTFLIQRGLSCGIIIAAPSIILSIILGWNLPITILAIGLPTIAYTMVGGVQAVTWTDVKQMGVILFAMTAAVIVLIWGMPKQVDTITALHIAGSVGRMKAVDPTFSLYTDYTLWSGMLGGLFLMLSYFGCDQSQVQRYLTAKSVNSARHSLLVSGFAKIPLQALILLTGVLTFSFFLFNRNPMLFNPVYERVVRESPRAQEYQALESEFDRKFDVRQSAALALADAQHHPDTPEYATARQAFQAAQDDIAGVRARAVKLVREVTNDNGYTDTNYVFPTFVLQYMPVGLVGLMIAAIISAAMSASSGEINALATATTIDFYRRLINPNAPDSASLWFSKMATAFWGLFACVAAYYAANVGSLIDTVNKIGSLFYGSILGVFILALMFKRTNARGAFTGVLAGLAVVFVVAYHPATQQISYLWHNLIGAVVCVAVGLLVSAATGGRKPTADALHA